MAPKTKKKAAKKAAKKDKAITVPYPSADFWKGYSLGSDLALALAARTIDRRINAVRSLALYSKRYDYETSLRHLKDLRQEIAAE